MTEVPKVDGNPWLFPAAPRNGSEARALTICGVEGAWAPAVDRPATYVRRR
jgi:hypothetical protein